MKHSMKGTVRAIVLLIFFGKRRESLWHYVRQPCFWQFVLNRSGALHTRYICMRVSRLKAEGRGGQRSPVFLFRNECIWSNIVKQTHLCYRISYTMDRFNGAVVFVVRVEIITWKAQGEIFCIVVEVFLEKNYCQQRLADECNRLLVKILSWKIP